MDTGRIKEEAVLGGVGQLAGGIPIGKISKTLTKPFDRTFRTQKVVDAATALDKKHGTDLVGEMPVEAQLESGFVEEAIEKAVSKPHTQEAIQNSPTEKPAIDCPN